MYTMINQKRRSSRGLGSVASNIATYPNMALACIRQIKNTPDIKNNLSYEANAQLLTMDTVLSTVPGYQTAQLVTNNVGQSFIDVASEIAGPVLVLGKAIFSEISNSIGGATTGIISDISKNIGDVANIIPIFGALVNIGIDIVNAVGKAGGIGPCNSDSDYRAAWCKDEFTRMRGSGPNNQFLPCDVFNNGINAFGEVSMPDVGNAFIIAFEYDFFTNEKVNLTETSVGANGTYGWGHGGSPDIISDTIPLATRQIISQLRQAIQSSYQQYDGGVSLWPLYLDICLKQINMGRINNDIITDRAHQYAAWCSAMDNGETCFSHDTSGVTAMYGMIDGWYKTIYSPYSQYKNPNGGLTEQQIIDKAKFALLTPAQQSQANAAAPAAMALVDALQKQKAATALFMSNINKFGILPIKPAAPKPSVAIVAPKKTSPTVAVAGGGALALAALLFFL